MRIKKILGAVALAVASTVAGAGHAVATAAPATDLPFAEQARILGLSNAQAVDLQEEVTTYLDKLGGNQVAINKIDLDSGGFVLVTLPGETYARDLENPSVAGEGDCPFTYLCAFKGNNFTGSFLALYTCDVTELMPWDTWGSYVNNQGSAHVGTFNVYISGTSGPTRPSYTAPAYSTSTPYNWSRTHSINPC